MHAFHFYVKRCALRYCIDELMQENTHDHRCLVAEDPAGVFHSSRSAGAWTARATDRKQRRGRVTENLRERCVALFLLHLPLALVLRCPTFPRWRGQNIMFGANVELFVAAAAAVWQLRTKWCRSWWSFRVVGYVILFRSTASKSADCVLWAYIHISQ